jgi:DNA-binding protein YbaB
MDDDELLRTMPAFVRPAVEAVLGLREKLTSAEVTATDDSGLVTAVTDVLGNLREIRLHPTARRQFDNLTLGDQVRDAVNAARAQAREEHRRLLDTVDVFGVPLGTARTDPSAAARRIIEAGGLGAIFGSPS